MQLQELSNLLNFQLNTTCAVVGAAVGVNLLLGLLAGFNSFPYFLLSLLYGGVAFAVLQLLHKFGTTPDAQVREKSKFIQKKIKL